MRDHFVWIDPWATLAVHKEALAIERRAYKQADTHRRKLENRLARIRKAVEPRRAD